jgi:hypothetical protein
MVAETPPLLSRAVTRAPEEQQAVRAETSTPAERMQTPVQQADTLAIDAGDFGLPKGSVDRLAREVFEQLRRRLALERERQGRSARLTNI